MKYHPKRPCRSYQAKALQMALKLNNAIAIWLDPGLGKTKVAIDFIAIQRIKNNMNKVLVICPMSAMGVWEDELKLDMPDEVNYKVFIITGSNKQRLERLNKALKNVEGITIIIITYDIACKFEEFGYPLRKYKPQILIVDEIHMCKNPTTDRTKAVYHIRQGVRWVLGLTGTPMPKNPLDIFAQYKILDETIFGKNYKNFRDRYAIMHPIFPSTPKEFINLDEMGKKIHQIACRVKDTEATGLPPLIEQTVPVEFTKKSQDIYNKMAEEMITELDNMEIFTASTAMVKVGKLQQICGGFLTRTDVMLGLDGKPEERKVTLPVGTEKLDIFMDLIQQYKENHKVLVGCRFLWEIYQIESRLKKGGVGYVTVRGGMDGDARTTARHQFQEDKSCRVIIFQVSAATAMTLTAGDIGILYSCTTRWDDYRQWLKRIHREGQTKPVLIQALAVRGTVDYHILDLIKAKADMESSIVDKSQYRKWLTPHFIKEEN